LLGCACSSVLQALVYSKIYFGGAITASAMSTFIRHSYRNFLSFETGRSLHGRCGAPDYKRPPSEVVTVMRSRSRVGVLLQLPQVIKHPYLSCMVDTSCKQTLQLPLLEAARAAQHKKENTQYFDWNAFFSTLQQKLMSASAKHPHRPNQFYDGTFNRYHPIELDEI
jgi:hypothetical protein